jgi:glycosyltransferase involved in cell wall biosynthesis
MISGAALVVKRLAENMAARGHAVLVLAASDRGPAYAVEEQGVRVARLGAWRNPTRHGQRFMAWPYGAVRKELQRFQPDLVHIEDFSPAAVACLQAAQSLKMRRVLTLHQLPWIVSTYAPAPMRPMAERLLWQHLRRLAQRCDAVLTPSRLAADLAAARLPARPTPLSNGIDLEQFSPKATSLEEGPQLRQKYHLDPDRPIILYCGRLDFEKRVDFVLRAAQRAIAQEPAQVLVVGDGVQRPMLEKLARQLDLPVVFTGYVGGEGDLPALYRLAATLIMASSVELLSGVVLEAQASGVPVVAARAGGLPELVEDGVSGFLAEPNDLTGFAERIVRVMRLTEPERKVMRKAALNVAFRHSLVNTLAVQEAFYQTILAQR